MRHRRADASSASPAALAMVFLSAAACDAPTSESIVRWKGTEKGPGKLRAALVDKGLPARLRGEAAAALWDIGQVNEVEQTFDGLPAGERWEIMKTLVPLWAEAGKTGGPRKATDARDGLFFLRGSAPPEERAQIDAVLLPAVAANLRTGNLTGGRHAVEKVVTALGAQAGPTLAQVLVDGTPALAAVAALLGKVGDAATRDRGAAIVVAQAEKESPIQGATWRALGAVGGKSSTDFLARKLESGKDGEAIEAAKSLQETRQPALLPIALKLAGSPATPKALREQLFGVIQSIGGAEARQGLVKIIAGDKDEVVRYLAFETAVNADRADAVGPALEAFPAGGTYKKEDVLDLLVRPIERDVGPPARASLVKALGSASTLTRMTAVLAFERLGTAADATAVGKLVGDSGVVKGFPAGDTVGNEAARVAAVIKSKAK